MPHIRLNVRRKSITGDTYRPVTYYTAKSYNSNLRRTATDVYHHASFRSLHIEAYPYGCSHRLIDEVNIPSPGML